MSLDEVLKKLRYVKRWPGPESEIRHEDLNTKIDTLKAIRDALKEKVGEDPLVDELDAILNLIPYAKAGDVVEPEHHNLIVDAMWKVRDILGKMESEYMKMIELLKAWTWALGIGLEYTVAPTIKLFYVLGLAYDIDFTTGKTMQYEKLLSLESMIAPTIKLFYKTGTINYMDCNLYNQTPYSEVILEKFTAS